MFGAILEGRAGSPVKVLLECSHNSGLRCCQHPAVKPLPMCDSPARMRMTTSSPFSFYHWGTSGHRSSCPRTFFSEYHAQAHPASFPWLCRRPLRGAGGFALQYILFRSMCFFPPPPHQCTVPRPLLNKVLPLLRSPVFTRRVRAPLIFWVPSKC